MVIFVKSYPKDFANLKVLIDSIDSYNVDNIPVYICIDKGNKKTFENTLGIDHHNIVYSEDILEDYSTEALMELKDMERWEIQQVLKFEFCKNTYESEHFLIVDSDSIFIRPFYIRDFYDEANNLYTIMRTVKKQIDWYAADVPHLDINLKEQEQMMSFNRKQIQSIIDREGEVYDFGPPLILWSQTVINDFYENYLVPNDLTFTSIIKKVPIEYNWYGEWLLKTEIIPVIPKEPMFKNIFWEDQYNTMIKNGISKTILAKDYLGINLQTNFSRPRGIIDYEL